MSDTEGDKIDSNATIKLLTEDIQAHRDYIHRLYRSAFTVGTVLVAIGIGLGYWVLGKQLDAKVFEYRVVESLRDRAKDISTEIIDVSKLAAKEEVNAFIMTTISSEVEKQVEHKLKEVSQESLSQLFERFAFPYGTVVAVNRDTCPSGWTEYKLAYGRFIRGIDKSNSKIDEDGQRVAGSIQEDSIQFHIHGTNLNGRNDWPTSGNMPTKVPASAEGSLNRKTTGPENARVSNETRPKNVALLYCEKR